MIQVTLSAAATSFAIDLEHYYALGIAGGAISQYTPPPANDLDKDAQAYAVLYQVGYVEQAQFPDDAATFSADVANAIQLGLSDGEAGRAGDSTSVVGSWIGPEREWLRSVYAVSRDKGRRLSSLPVESTGSGAVWKLLLISAGIAGIFVLGNAIIGVGAKKNPKPLRRTIYRMRAWDGDWRSKDLMPGYSAHKVATDHATVGEAREAAERFMRSMSPMGSEAKIYIEESRPSGDHTTTDVWLAGQGKEIYGEGMRVRGGLEWFNPQPRDAGARRNPAKWAAWTHDREVFVPDVEITRDSPEYVYEPLRGYSNLLAVMDIDDRYIGWIKTGTLGYDNAQQWMKATRWLAR